MDNNLDNKSDNNFENTQLFKEEKIEKTRRQLFFEILGTKIWELFGLNILFVLFSVPLITIGPATCGVVRVTRNYALDKQAFLWGDFWKGFKQNFFRSLAISIPTGLAVLGSVAGFFVYSDLAASVSKGWYIFMALTILIGIVMVMMNFYAYIMLIFTDIDIKGIYKNAFILTIVAFKTNFLLFLFCGVLIAAVGILWFYVKFMTLLFLFIPFAFNWYIICFNCYPIVNKYIIEPYYAD
ncbi:MAG: YesL family protein [Oscillospiraceae bacterium]|nr:YesL family protein [Oscillospiraceae bacterium]